MDNYSSISKDIYDWIHPLSSWPTFYSLLAYDKHKDQVYLLDTVNTSSLSSKIVPTIKNGKAGFRFKLRLLVHFYIFFFVLSVLVVKSQVGFERSSSRAGFQALFKGKSNKAAWKLLVDILPSFSFVFLYHSYYLYNYIKLKRSK